MSFSEFKNESLFAPRFDEYDARATVAYALRMGWAHPPAAVSENIRAPLHKKRAALDCEQFRTDAPKKPRPVRRAPAIPSDVPDPQ